MKAKLYARKCTKTGKGFNKGFVCADGTNFKEEADLIEDLKRCDPEATECRLDEEIIENSYNEGGHMYTIFECLEDMNYIEIEGKLYDITIHLSDYWNK